MGGFVETMSEYYTLLEGGDPRSSKLPLLANPKWVVCLAFGYMFAVYYGRKFMQHREAFDLRNVLIGYNAFSVLFSLWMLYDTIACTILNPNFDLLNEKIDPLDTSPVTMRMIHSHWFYFFSKILEFSDTAFFVLRKKNGQISFLHVYHHVSMLLLQWLVVKFVPGGPSYFGNLCNCFIHAVMYAYYGLAACGPHMQKYLWWKRYLTKMQMYQFVAIFLYCCNSIAVGEQAFVKSLMWVHLVYMISMFYLFNAFYQSSYTRRSQATKTSLAEDQAPSSLAVSTSSKKIE